MGFGSFLDRLRPYSMVVTYSFVGLLVGWFGFWFGVVGVASWWGALLVFLFNPFVFLGLLRLWWARDSLSVVVDVLSVWMGRKFPRKEKDIVLEVKEK